MRYLKVADVPAFLADLAQAPRSQGMPLFQTLIWQNKWITETDKPIDGAAVLSYRWRTRANEETVSDFLQWLEDLGQVGYQPCQLRQEIQRTPELWTVADALPEIEVALWMLWVHATRQADHLWVDQFCVPQDVDIDTKMGHVRESPSIYSSGAVFVILAPVVSYATGRILTMAAARELAAPHLQRAGVGYSMEDSALKALLINNSYFRRVWTIQEAVAAQSLSMWPLLGSGNTVDSYQSLWVLDWPQFNKWGEARYSGTLRDTSAANGSVQAYLDGDYTGLLGVLGSGAPEGIQYLSMAARQAMWATLDRAGLVNEIKTAPSPAQRAFVVLNKHQVFGSRAGWPEDRVLALVPLIDYDGWRHATAAAAGHQLVQASVSWAYDVWQRSDGGGGGGSRLGSLAKWSIRIFNSSRVATTCLDVLHPRRNLDDRSSVHGAVAGGRQATFEASASQPGTGALVLAGGGRLEVLTACVMPHPGVPRLSWGPSHMPWTSVRDALGTNEDFRLATEWACEEYLGHDECAKDVVAVLLTAASGSPTGMPHLVIAGLTAPSRDRGRVMMVMDIAPGAVASVAEALRIKCQDMLTAHLPLA